MKKRRPAHKSLGIKDAILGIIAVALVAHFAPKIFGDAKDELVSMNAVSDMQMAFRNVKQFAVAHSGSIKKDEEELFWQGTALNSKPWWASCFHIALNSADQSYIKITQNQALKNEEELKKCSELYAEPQIQRWLKDQKIYF